MKQKTKHLSKTTMSILLALVLVVSTLAVGIVSTSAAYLNGKPNTEANAADVAGDDAVGAKDSEAVGAQAGDSVGSNDAKGTFGYSIYFKSKNSTSYDVEYYNAYDVNITVNVADLKLDDTTLKFKVKSYKSGESDVWWGNNNVVNSPGSNTTLANNSENGGYFKNANNYTSITLKLAKDGNDLKMYWVSGVSTAHTISYGSTTNGSFTTAPTSASSGDTVTVVATPSTGYQVSSVTYTPSGGSETACTQGSGNTYTFEMPDYDVEVNATFSVASYAVTATCDNCTLTLSGESPYAYNSSVTFTVTPQANYALQTLTVKQGTTNVQYTDNLDGTYTFTMPAGDVAINAVCANTSGTTTVYFKSATAYVYHPLISVNGGTEQAMTVDTTKYLNNGTNKSSAVKPKSDTGSLRYAWYKIELTDVDLSSPVSIVIRGQDTYMEATGTFTLTEGGSVYLACDNLMEGNTLVNLTSASDAVKDFYDTPLHMVATAAEIAAINGN